MNPALLNNKTGNSKKSGVNILPSWFKQELPDVQVLEKKRLFSKLRLHTVCQEANCPNINYCFKNNKFTFIILGDTCTRHCCFCAVNKSSENKLSLSEEEPQAVARCVEVLGLRYVVITSVTRDDLFDGGAGQFSRTVRMVKALDSTIKVEVLIPDFQGNLSSLQRIIDSGADTIAHNIETVSRLYPYLREKSDYQRSLMILKRIKELSPGIRTKSSIMLGMGETEAELMQAMRDLRSNGCDFLTLGQYLAPSRKHYAIKEFIQPEQFQEYKRIAEAMGFKAVLSGPLVRSSYQAEELYYEFAYA